MAYVWSHSRRFACLAFVAPFFLAAQEKAWDRNFQDGAEAFRAGRYAEAVVPLKAALQSAQSFPPLDLRRADIAQLLAMSYQFQGKFDVAEPLFFESKRILEASGVAGRSQLGITLDSLGQLRFEQTQLKEAEAFERQAIQLCTETLGESGLCTLEAKRHLGEIYSYEGRNEEAEILFQRVISLARRIPSFTKLLSATLRAQAHIIMARGQLKQAEPLLKEALEIGRKLGAEHSEVADSLVALARLYRLEGDPDRAVPLLHRASAIYEKNNDACVAQASLQLGLIEISQGKYALAGQHLLRTVTILKSFLGPEHLNVGYAEAALAEAYLGERNYIEAKLLIDHALAIESASLTDSHHDELAHAHMTAARISQAQEQGRDADSHYRQALDIYRSFTPRNNPDRIVAERQYERFAKSFRK